MMKSLSRGEVAAGCPGGTGRFGSGPTPTNRSTESITPSAASGFAVTATVTSIPSSAPGFCASSVESSRGSMLSTESMRTPFARLISSSNVRVSPGASTPRFSRYCPNPNAGLIRVLSCRTRMSINLASGRSVSMTMYFGTARPGDGEMSYRTR